VARSRGGGRLIEWRRSACQCWARGAGVARTLLKILWTTCATALLSSIPVPLLLRCQGARRLRAEGGGGGGARLGCELLELGLLHSSSVSGRSGAELPEAVEHLTMASESSHSMRRSSWPSRANGDCLRTRRGGARRSGRGAGLVGAWPGGAITYWVSWRLPRGRWLVLERVLAGSAALCVQASGQVLACVVCSKLNYSTVAVVGVRSPPGALPVSASLSTRSAPKDTELCLHSAQQAAAVDACVGSDGGGGGCQRGTTVRGGSDGHDQGAQTVH
jgi:hypothetical protein